MVDRSLPTVVHCVMLVWMDVQLISALPSAQSLRVHSVRSKAWKSNNRNSRRRFLTILPKCPCQM